MRPRSLINNQNPDVFYLDTIKNTICSNSVVSARILNKRKESVDIEYIMDRYRHIIDINKDISESVSHYVEEEYEIEDDEYKVEEPIEEIASFDIEDRFDIIHKEVHVISKNDLFHRCSKLFIDCTKAMNALGKKRRSIEDVLDIVKDYDYLYKKAKNINKREEIKNLLSKYRNAYIDLHLNASYMNYFLLLQSYCIKKNESELDSKVKNELLSEIEDEIGNITSLDESIEVLRYNKGNIIIDVNDNNIDDDRYQHRRSFPIINENDVIEFTTSFNKSIIKIKDLYEKYLVLKNKKEIAIDRNDKEEIKNIENKIKSLPKIDIITRIFVYKKLSPLYTIESKIKKSKGAYVADIAFNQIDGSKERVKNVEILKIFDDDKEMRVLVNPVSIGKTSFKRGYIKIPIIYARNNVYYINIDGVEYVLRCLMHKKGIDNILFLSQPNIYSNSIKNISDSFKLFKEYVIVYNYSTYIRKDIQFDIKSRDGKVVYFAQKNEIKNFIQKCFSYAKDLTDVNMTWQNKHSDKLVRVVFGFKYNYPVTNIYVSYDKDKLVYPIYKYVISKEKTDQLTYEGKFDVHDKYKNVNSYTILDKLNPDSYLEPFMYGEGASIGGQSVLKNNIYVEMKTIYYKYDENGRTESNKNDYDDIEFITFLRYIKESEKYNLKSAVTDPIPDVLLNYMSIKRINNICRNIVNSVSITDLYDDIFPKNDNIIHGIPLLKKGSRKSFPIKGLNAKARIINEDDYDFLKMKCHDGSVIISKTLSNHLRYSTLHPIRIDPMYIKEEYKNDLVRDSELLLKKGTEIYEIESGESYKIPINCLLKLMPFRDKDSVYIKRYITISKYLSYLKNAYIRKKKPARWKTDEILISLVGSVEEMFRKETKKTVLDIISEDKETESVDGIYAYLLGYLRNTVYPKVIEGRKLYFSIIDPITYDLIKHFKTLTQKTTHEIHNINQFACYYSEDLSPEKIKKLKDFIENVYGSDTDLLKIIEMETLNSNIDKKEAIKRYLESCPLMQGDKLMALSGGKWTVSLIIDEKKQYSVLDKDGIINKVMGKDLLKSAEIVLPRNKLDTTAFMQEMFLTNCLTSVVSYLPKNMQARDRKNEIHKIIDDITKKFSENPESLKEYKFVHGNKTIVIKNETDPTKMRGYVYLFEVPRRAYSISNSYKTLKLSDNVTEVMTSYASSITDTIYAISKERIEKFSYYLNYIWKDINGNVSEDSKENTDIINDLRDMYSRYISKFKIENKKEVIKDLYRLSIEEFQEKYKKADFYVDEYIEIIKRPTYLVDMTYNEKNHVLISYLPRKPVSVLRIEFENGIRNYDINELKHLKKEKLEKLIYDITHTSPDIDISGMTSNGIDIKEININKEFVFDSVEGVDKNGYDYEYGRLKYIKIPKREFDSEENKYKILILDDIGNTKIIAKMYMHFTDRIDDYEIDIFNWYVRFVDNYVIETRESFREKEKEIPDDIKKIINSYEFDAYRYIEFFKNSHLFNELFKPESVAFNKCILLFLKKKDVESDEKKIKVLYEIHKLIRKMISVEQNTEEESELIHSNEYKEFIAAGEIRVGGRVVKLMAYDPVVFRENVPDFVSYMIKKLKDDDMALEYIRSHVVSSIRKCINNITIKCIYSPYDKNQIVWFYKPMKARIENDPTADFIMRFNNIYKYQKDFLFFKKIDRHVIKIRDNINPRIIEEGTRLIDYYMSGKKKRIDTHICNALVKGGYMLIVPSYPDSDPDYREYLKKYIIGIPYNVFPVKEEIVKDIADNIDNRTLKETFIALHKAVKESKFYEMKKTKKENRKYVEMLRLHAHIDIELHKPYNVILVSRSTFDNLKLTTKNALVIYREPVVHKGSIQVLKPIVSRQVSDNVVAISPHILKPFNADYDGDNIFMIKSKLPLSRKIMLTNNYKDTMNIILTMLKNYRSDKNHLYSDNTFDIKKAIDNYLSEFSDDVFYKLHKVTEIQFIDVFRKMDENAIELLTNDEVLFCERLLEETLPPKPDVFRDKLMDIQNEQFSIMLDIRMKRTIDNTKQTIAVVKVGQNRKKLALHLQCYSPKAIEIASIADVESGMGKSGIAIDDKIAIDIYYNYIINVLKYLKKHTVDEPFVSDEDRDTIVGKVLNNPTAMNIIKNSVHKGNYPVEKIILKKDLMTYKNNINNVYKSVVINNILNIFSGITPSYKLKKISDNGGNCIYSRLITGTMSKSKRYHKLFSDII